MPGPVPTQIFGLGLHFKTSVKSSMGAATREAQEAHLSGKITPLFLRLSKEKEKLVYKGYKVSEKSIQSTLQDIHP